MQVYVVSYVVMSFVEALGHFQHYCDQGFFAISPVMARHALFDEIATVLPTYDKTLF